MKSYLIIFILIVSNYTYPQIKNANCVEYDNNRVRCLAKKRCKWKPGVGAGKGFCLYQDLLINQDELMLYQEEQKLKIKCADEQNNYKALEQSLERATIYQDTLAIKSLNQKINQQKLEVLKITGCLLPKSLADQKKEQNLEFQMRQNAVKQQAITQPEVPANQLPSQNDDEDNEDSEDSEE